MTYSETRAHLQSFENKMEFIRPKLTEIWQFEILVFLKINRKNPKTYRGESVNKFLKILKFSLKCDFSSRFSYFYGKWRRKTLLWPISQVSFEICLIWYLFHRDGDTRDRKYRTPLKFQYFKNGWKLVDFYDIFGN